MSVCVVIFFIGEYKAKFRNVFFRIEYLQMGGMVHVRCIVGCCQVCLRCLGLIGVQEVLHDVVRIAIL